MKNGGVYAAYFPLLPSSVVKEHRQTYIITYILKERHKRLNFICSVLIYRISLSSVPKDIKMRQKLIFRVFELLP